MKKEVPASPEKHRYTAEYKIVSKATGKLIASGVKPLDRAMSTENIKYLLANEYDVQMSTHYIDVKRVYTN